jgi:hypothetical protein
VEMNSSTVQDVSHGGLNRLLKRDPLCDLFRSVVESMRAGTELRTTDENLPHSHLHPHAHSSNGHAKNGVVGLVSPLFSTAPAVRDEGGGLRRALNQTHILAGLTGWFDTLPHTHRRVLCWSLGTGGTQPPRACP